jgi:hypothetical protein
MKNSKEKCQKSSINLIKNDETNIYILMICILPEFMI